MAAVYGFVLFLLVLFGAGVALIFHSHWATGAVLIFLAAGIFAFVQGADL